ncbi:MAG: CsgG/HfaB family protein [Pararhodobacter sp.]
MMALAMATGCAPLSQHIFADPGRDVDVPQGPPVSEVVTLFDSALECVNGMIGPEVAFAVGNIQDSTGRVDGNAGTMVTQGAGDMIQSALFRAGLTVINRRDANIAVTEANWGIRDIRRQTPVDFYISGSINSLDFIPGGAASVTVAGVGPRARQNRVLVGLDLAISDAFSGRLIGNVSLQKQIFTREFGISVGRFFDDILVTGDAGYVEREALHFSLRQMLNLGTLLLLGHVIREEPFQTCREQIEPFTGGVRLNRQPAQTARRAGPALAVEVPSVAARAEAEAEAEVAAAAPQTAATPPATAPTRPEYEVLGEEARRLAARAITAARDSESAETRNEAARLAAQSLQLANAALQRLQQAARAGLDGDEGDVAAVVVQQSITRSRAAGAAAADRPADVPRVQEDSNNGTATDDGLPDVSPGDSALP